MRPEVLVPIGLPASGKTTLSKEWLAEDPDGRIRVNYDELRLGMFGPEWIWNRKDEEAMKANARRIVTDAIRAGLSVVIDNTNLSRHVRTSWEALAKEFGASYVEQDIPTSRLECIARDRLRHGRKRVGQAVIDGMALRYGLVDWDDYGPWHHQGLKAPIAIWDLDGTLADCAHRLVHLKKPLEHKMDCSGNKGHLGWTLVIDGRCRECGAKPYKDWVRFYEGVDADKPITLMFRLLEKLGDHIHVVISGRPVSSGRNPVGIITEDWLRGYMFYPDLLLLRQDGDHKPDYEYKKEWLELLPKERVQYVFEDRSQVVAMYRRELPGAIVMQVAEGSY